MKNRHTIQRNPVTTAGSGGLTFVGLLTSLGASPKLIAIVSFVGAILVAGLRDLTKPGGSTVIVPTLRGFKQAWKDLTGT
jgi:hypothetical protein